MSSIQIMKSHFETMKKKYVNFQQIPKINWCNKMTVALVATVAFVQWCEKNNDQNIRKD